MPLDFQAVPPDGVVASQVRLSTENAGRTPRLCMANIGSERRFPGSASDAQTGGAGRRGPSCRHVLIGRNQLPYLTEHLFPFPLCRHYVQLGAQAPEVIHNAVDGLD